MITPATSQLRRLRQWPPVLVAMLRARGVRPLDDDGQRLGHAVKIASGSSALTMYCPASTISEIFRSTARLHST